MSSIAKCHRDEQAQARKEIHGTRPSPLKISRDSHLICKKTWSSSSSSFIPSRVQDIEPHTRDDDDDHQQQQLQRKTKHPIIIYTHSPKVIHTQPRDFMALVQKLTGLSRPKNDESSASLSQSSQGRSLKKSSSPCEEDRDDKIKDRHMLVAINSDHDNESSSVITNDDTCCKDSTQVQMNPSSDPYFTNMPLFTPIGKDMFPSSRPIHRYADSSPVGIVSSAFSPCGFDFFSGLSEY